MILGEVKNRIKSDFDKACKSIKIPEVEEWFDIYFSRFFGYYLALISRFFGLSPHQVSLLSLLSGFVAGYLFFFQEDLTLVLWACFFITFSGLLDSADGQLARMTNTASDLGRKIDAIIDTFVFVACYVGGSLYFFMDTPYGWYIFPLAVLAGYSHSAKSAAYEFYKTEFMYYLGNDSGYRIPNVSDLKTEKRQTGFWNTCLYYLELDYTGKQDFFVSRSYETRLKFESWAQESTGSKFIELYKKYNHSILTWWALTCGTNVHRTVLMISSCFGRMDLYFYFSIVGFIPYMVVNRFQKKKDDQLQKEMNSATILNA
ncbi:MAG: CDP-alcohol phosphatidyltransferase family protein [Cyclobacteriaceae bacterium]